MSRIKELQKQDNKILEKMEEMEEIAEVTGGSEDTDGIRPI